MSIPRDRHFIPAFYLQQWTGADRKVIQFNIQRGKLHWRPLTPQSTGYQTDLYAFPELPEHEAQFLESVYFQFADDLAAKALELHLRGAHFTSWTRKLRSAWTRFVMGIHWRHPDAMPELRAEAKAEWDRSGPEYQARYEAIKKPGDPPTFDQYIAAIDPLFPYTTQLDMIIKGLDHPHIGAHINRMPFSIFDLSSANIELLTSDRPVEVFAMSRAQGLISMPISPTKLFVAVNDLDTLNFLGRQKPRDLVRCVNRNLVERARRYVWGGDLSQRQFIGNHFGRRMEQLPLAIRESQR
jgi:hypothetical protein